MSAPATTPVRLAELNGLARDAFVERVGFVFELSPWVAEEAWEARPFASVDDLHAAMLRAVERASPERQLELIRSHSDLGSTNAEGELTAASGAEQAAAGLDRMPADLYARLTRATAAYRGRFGFPLVVCVREHTVQGIVEHAEGRVERDEESERRTALGEIAKIAALRLNDTVSDGNDASKRQVDDESVAGTVANIAYEITYGKAGVPVYRHYATPLSGLPRVPESSFTGRDNAMFANEVTIEVFGQNFLPAYTQGDNSKVVATDSIKNFILREGRVYAGATLEGYLDHLGNGLLAKYEQMHGLRISGRELPFSVQPVPGPNGFEPSGVLRQRQWSDHSTAELRYERDDERWAFVAHRCGRVNIELLKTKGSAFTKFVRDEYTTLPEREDRPLFIHLDVHWRYADAVDLIHENHRRYVAGEQVRDVCAVVFHEFVSESIQQLLHEMGKRLLERYPQLRTVELVGKNMTHDPYAVSEDPQDDRKVFVPPFPALGTITLAMTRSA